MFQSSPEFPGVVPESSELANSQIRRRMNQMMWTYHKSHSRVFYGVVRSFQGLFQNLQRWLGVRFAEEWIEQRELTRSHTPEYFPELSRVSRGCTLIGIEVGLFELVGWCWAENFCDCWTQTTWLKGGHSDGLLQHVGLCKRRRKIPKSGRTISNMNIAVPHSMPTWTHIIIEFNGEGESKVRNVNVLL